MLTQESVAIRDKFIAEKKKQLDSIKPMHGLTRAQTGDQFVLMFSANYISEGVVIGQLERSEMKILKSGRQKPAFVERFNSEKRPENQHIDLFDDEVSQILSCWEMGKTVKNLEFVVYSWSN